MCESDVVVHIKTKTAGRTNRSWRECAAALVCRHRLFTQGLRTCQQAVCEQARRRVAAMMPVDRDESMIAKENTCVVAPSELESLQRFTASCNLALSLYLDLRSVNRGESAMEAVDRLARQQRQSLGTQVDDETWDALQEDLEMIKLYLKTNGNRSVRSLAIFSCAGDYFWRAYQLPYPVPTHLHVGPHLDTEHLARACVGDSLVLSQLERLSA